MNMNFDGDRLHLVTIFDEIWWEYSHDAIGINLYTNDELKYVLDINDEEFMFLFLKHGGKSNVEENNIISNFYKEQHNILRDILTESTEILA